MSLSAVVAAINHAPLWRRAMRVWGFRLTPPSCDRWLYLAAHRCGLMGQAEKRFLERTIAPGMRIADIGANLGLYSLLLARLAGPGGKVFAFEPAAPMVEALRHNLIDNAATAVQVFPCAVGATAGEGILQPAAFNSGNTALTHRRDAGDETALRVSIRSLDEALAGQSLDFIKMDVQGWEGEIWQGMDGLLRANPHLAVYFEFWPKGLKAAGMPIARLQEIIRARGMQVTLAEVGADSIPVDLEVLAQEMNPGAYLNLLAKR